MINPISDIVNTTETGDETHSLTGHESGDINSAGSSLITSVTLEEVARLIETATDPQTKQLERLWDLMKKLRQVPPKRNEETSGLMQGSSISPSHRFGKTF